MSFLGTLLKRPTAETVVFDVPVKRPKVLIGVAGFLGVVPQCQENFFGFAYRCGRDHPEYDFLLKIIIKKEQFRARNNLVDLALVNDCDYLLMLDDDMDIPPDLFGKLSRHDKDVTGALYYQRGGAYHPVIMKQVSKKVRLKGIDFIHHFDAMITKPGLYELDGIIGGGCMLFKTDVFRKLQQPYFWIDGIVGTDVHICNQLREAGVKIHVDTSIELGHLGEPPLITSRNIPTYNQEIGKVNEAFWEDLKSYFCMNDIEMEQAVTLACAGNAREVEWNREPRDTWEQVRKYYQQGDKWHVLNLAAYNLKHDEARAWVINNMKRVVPAGGSVVDLGCGNGYVSLPLAQRDGLQVTAMDLTGVPTLDFVQDRIKKHDLVGRMTTKEFDTPVPSDLDTPVDAILMISMFDHLWDAHGMMAWAAHNLKPGGYLVCDSWRTLKKETEPQHLLKFDPHTIERQFRKLGLTLMPEHPFLFKKEA